MSDLREKLEARSSALADIEEKARLLRQWLNEAPLEVRRAASTIANIAHSEQAHVRNLLASHEERELGLEEAESFPPLGDLVESVTACAEAMMDAARDSADEHYGRLALRAADFIQAYRHGRLRSHTDREPDGVTLTGALAIRNGPVVQAFIYAPGTPPYKEWRTVGGAWIPVYIGPPVQPEDPRLRAEAEASVRLDGTTMMAEPEEES